MEGEDVYATLLTNDRYLPGAMVLAHALRDGGTRDGVAVPGTSKKLAVLVGEGRLSKSSLDELSTLFDYIIAVPIISCTALDNLELLGRLELNETFTKIHLWRQTQFRKIVYIDADVLPIVPPDELFHVDEAFAACPDIGWPDCFNSGVFVMKPSQETYEDLNGLAQTGQSFDGADQGLLNNYFEGKWYRLPFSYNCTPSGSYQYTPAYRHYGSKISMVHFIGASKPWESRADNYHYAGPFSQHLERWWAVWDKHYVPKGRETSTNWAHYKPPSVYRGFVGFSSEGPAVTWVPPPPITHHHEAPHYNAQNRDSHHHAPQHHTPQDHTPQHHTPQHHVPQHHTPQHHAPQHHAPQHHAPQHHAPQHHVPHHDPHHSDPQHRNPRYGTQTQVQHESAFAGSGMPEPGHRSTLLKPAASKTAKARSRPTRPQAPRRPGAAPRRPPTRVFPGQQPDRPASHQEEFQKTWGAPSNFSSPITPILNQSTTHSHYQEDAPFEVPERLPIRPSTPEDSHSLPTFDQYASYQPTFMVSGTPYVHRSQGAYPEDVDPEEDEPYEEEEGEYVPPFEAPNSEWDPARSPPPASAGPEGYCLSFQAYKNEWDMIPGLVSTGDINISGTLRNKPRNLSKPAKTESPPQSPTYQVPSVKPVFPWESRALPPARVFPDDQKASGDRARDFDSEGTRTDDESTASFEELDEEGMSDAETAMEGLNLRDYGYVINQWDAVPGISEYVSALQRHKSQFKPGKTGPPKLNSPFDERLPLPPTPNPLRRRINQGSLQKYPSAPGIPPPDQWDPNAKLDDLRQLPVSFLQRQAKRQVNGEQNQQ